MEELKSVLPPIEELREESTMRMIPICTAEHESVIVETSLRVRRDTERRLNPVSPLFGKLYKLDDPRVNGYMPSKVWAKCPHDELTVLFYVNNTLPKTVRPFEGNTYLLVYHPRYGDVVEYDVNVRLFIDQLATDNGIVYVFMFGDESYKDIIVKELRNDG